MLAPNWSLSGGAKPDGGDREVVLVPIRIDLDIDGIRVRDTFTWNANETSISYDRFAELLCDDLRLPRPTFATPIARAIQDQATDFFDRRRQFEDPHGRGCNGEGEGVDDRDLPEMRVPIKVGSCCACIRVVLRVLAYADVLCGQVLNQLHLQLDITIGGISLVDSFDWDINCGRNSPEQFADRLVREMGLTLEFRTAIAHSIREQVQTYERSLFILEHPFDGATPIDDEDLAACFLPPVTRGLRPLGDLYAGEPYLVVTRDLEAERADKDRERDARRKRRQTGRRRLLPDRDFPRIARTPLPHPSLYASPAAAAGLTALRRAASSSAASVSSPAAAGSVVAAGAHDMLGHAPSRRKTRAEAAAAAAAAATAASIASVPASQVDFRHDDLDPLATELGAPAPSALRA
ncbi:SWI SNF, matrix associated, actin dependent regulator of chromatin, sub b, member 1, partial [Cladochytrium tenue]